MIKKLSEEKRYTVNGIDIDIRINYRKERITLIDEKRNKKQWLFAEREIQYLDSWVEILEAMQEAIKLAKIDLDEYLDEHLDEDLWDEDLWYVN